MSARAAAKPKRRENSAGNARVAVQFAAGTRGIPSAASLRRWARGAARGATEIVLRIVGAAEARRLNREFRKLDHATDVLTFAYARRPLRGDIVLCHPVLARAARQRGLALAAHYAHLVVHGMLHLRGFDHRRAADARRMARAEARVLAQFGFGDPYAVEFPQRAREGRRRGR